MQLSNIKKNFTSVLTGRADLPVFPEMSGKKNQQCDACDNNTANANDLATHVKEVHTKPKKIHECPECKFKFPSNSRLTQHINDVHKKIKPYKVGTAFILHVYFKKWPLLCLIVQPR